MRRWLVLLITFGLAPPALAATGPTANRINTEGKGTFMGDGARSPRSGGEDIPGAALISSIPFSDTGVTCGYADDYDEVCPYTGSTSPDVVYKYTPVGPEQCSIDLCASSYDTKVYVYAGGPGNLVACNDDAGCGYSGWQSRIASVTMSPGVTYYFVIDGYGGACGTYSVEFGGIGPQCPVVCPEGAYQEGEPPCGLNYVDSYNGGCNSEPDVFQPMVAQNQGCADMCGATGTYLYNGLSYRDTDWFDCIGTGQDVTATLTVDFPGQLIIIYNPDCNDLQYVVGACGPCVPVTLSHYIADGAHVWLWAGPSVFDNVPCSLPYGNRYLLHACGIAASPPPVPAREMSWGAVKTLYR